MPALRELRISNFRSLQRVDVVLGPLNVLVGPNAAGKSNLLECIGFLGDIARDDLTEALLGHGGLESILFRGGTKRPASLNITVTAEVTEYSGPNAPDEYSLSLTPIGRIPRYSRLATVVGREERFTFKRTRGVGRRITVTGRKVQIADDKKSEARQLSLSAESAALSTLPRLGDADGARQVRAMADLFATFQVFDPDVAAARRPSSVVRSPRLSANAENLASYLFWLADEHPDVFSLFVDDLRAIVPGVTGVHFEPVGGATDAVSVQLEERSLRGRTSLANASFGTVRAMALLSLLHDPAPPKLRCVEEIEYGLHPYALDRLVDRLRAASERGQLLLASHSPALVNRLRPEELIVCERDLDTGASRIPSISLADVRRLMDGDELGLGELWFSGALGGNP